MKREFAVVIERDEEGYFVADVPALKGCHTQAKSLDALMERTKEAIALCLEARKKERSKPHLVGVQTVEVTV
jgi:predicted RNase H-like HicB family nuclease